MRRALLLVGGIVAVLLVLSTACRAAAPTPTPTRPAATPTATRAPATPTSTTTVAQPTATPTTAVVQPTTAAPTATPTQAPTGQGTPIDTLVAQAKARGEGVLHPSVADKLVKGGVRLQKPPLPTTSPKYGGTGGGGGPLTHYSWGVVGSMDPYVDLFMNTYVGVSDTLLSSGYGPAYSPAGMVVLPMQAKTWEYKDPTTLVLTLNKGMKFQNRPPVNGREIKAQDWAWSFEKTRATPKLAGAAARLQPVTSFKALDDYTLEIKTERPYAYLLAALTMASSGGAFSVWPREMYDGGKAPTNPEDVVGSGPWMVDKWSPGSELRFKRNPDYWAHWSGPKDNLFVADPSKPQLPFMDGHSWLQLTDDTTADAGFRAQKVDQIGWLRTVPKSRYESIKSTNPDTTWTILLNPGNRRPLFFRVDEPPFDNIKVRQAFSAAIDQEGMCSGPNIGWCVPGEYAYAAVGEWFLPNSEYGEGAKYSGNNLELGKKLLAEAGYTAAKPLEVELHMAPTVPWWQAENELLIANLTDLGIKLKVHSVDYNALVTLTLGAQWHGADRASGLACSGPDPDEFLRACLYSKGSGAAYHLNDPKLDAMLDAQSGELDHWKRVGLVYEIIRYLAVQRYGTFFAGAQVTAYGTQPYVKNDMANWAASGLGYALAITWIDRENPNVGFQPL
ncbi:MAG: ABC transporter substrate-binding protein [Chloroflexi bacterium]|nr:ABC transporter substrate-binding protein [Chloroflexota bacterium]